MTHTPRRCPLQRKRAALRFVTGLARERGSRRPSRRWLTPMATAVQKITLSSSRDIPFNKLVLASPTSGA
jgi:ParB family chromosome partitioning protein